MILVKKDDFINSLSKDEWKQYLKNEGGVSDMVSAIPEASNFSYFVIDNYPGLIVDAVYEAERLGLSPIHI